MPGICPTCGHEVKQPRSLPQHKRFFGLIRAMYANWPEMQDFQPHSEEHLRKWVLCMSGHRTVIRTLTMPRTSSPSLMAAFMQFSESLLEIDGRFGRWKGSTLAVYEADSIAFDKLSHAKFCDLNNSVEPLVHEVFGLSGDELLAGMEAAA